MPAYIIEYEKPFFVLIPALEQSVLLVEEFRDKNNPGIQKEMLPDKWYDVTPTDRYIPRS